ncbi:uncharacterized protein LOC136086892 [Hydra vulgaris]|uniref:Uncharacterized protein LOC136086892 n=1 Tax=Hydra vulgaris TaxID=6087 RepID=A0ABM4CU57_HYDVU
MTEHLIKLKLLPIHQHGFVSGKFCPTNLLEVLHIITEATDYNFMAVLISLDFSKVFDRVSHVLNIKLNGYGFDVKLTVWISDFLKSRRQQVVLDGVYSDLAKITGTSNMKPIYFIKQGV